MIPKVYFKLWVKDSLPVRREDELKKWQLIEYDCNIKFVLLISYDINSWLLSVFHMISYKNWNKNGNHVVNKIIKSHHHTIFVLALTCLKASHLRTKHCIVTAARYNFSCNSACCFSFCNSISFFFFFVENNQIILFK
jgi:hypothetical protein